MKTSYLIAAVGVALAAIYLLQHFFLNSEDSEMPPTPVEILADPVPDVMDQPVAPVAIIKPEPVEAEPAVVEPALPTLDESDGLLKEWATALEFPTLWLEQEFLLRRMASLLDGAARGTYPKRQLEFLLPEDKFEVYTKGKQTFLDTVSYQRFRYLPELLESVPVSSMAAYWHRVRPLVVEALAELGQRDAPELLLQQVVAQLNAVPLLEQPIELARPSVLYRFREDELEQRTAVERLFLRMGPSNIKRLRRYANALIPLLEQNSEPVVVRD